MGGLLMAAPEIISWAMGTLPVGASSSSVVYFDRAITDCEVSVDGGTTWYGIGDGTVTEPTTGTDLSVDALDPARPNRATLTLAGATTAGLGTWKVRGVNADGAGPAETFAIYAYVAAGQLVGISAVLPHNDLIWPSAMCAEADGDGFVIAYSPVDTGVGNAYNLDFGGGVTINVGSFSATQKGFVVLVRYSAGGVAQDATALIGNRLVGSSPPVATASHMRTDPDGSGYWVATNNIHRNSSLTLTYKRASGATGSFTSSYGQSAVWRIDASLTPSFAFLAKNTLSLVQVMSDGDTIINTGETLYKTGSGTSVVSSAWHVHRVSRAGAWIGAYGILVNGSLTEGVVYGSATLTDTFWMAWGSSGSYTTVELRQWTTSGSTTLHTSTLAPNNHRLFAITGDTYNGKIEYGKGVYPINAAGIGGHVVWLLSVDQSKPADQRRWNGVEIVPTVPSGSELVVAETGSFGFVLSSATGSGATSGWGNPQALVPARSPESTTTALAAGAVVAYPGWVTTSDAATAFGHTAYAGGADGLAIRIGDAATIEAPAVAYRASLSTNEAVNLLTSAWGDPDDIGGGWGVVKANGSTTAVTLDPPGIGVAPGTASDVYMVASLTAGGAWATSSVAGEVPADPDEPVPPTDPVVTCDAVVAEGATVIATLSTTDPNAGLPAHPDPIMALNILIWDSATGTMRTTGTTSALGGTVEVANDGIGGASIQVAPHADYDGLVRFAAQAVAVADSGAVYASNVVEWQVDWLAEPDPAVGPTGAFGVTDEDTPVTATLSVQDPDADDAWTWQVSPDQSSPWDPISSSAVTVFDTSDGTTPAGSVTIVAGQGTKSAQLTFSPAANWHGDTGVSVRVVDNTGENLWEWFPITVNPVVDPPGPITPASVTVDEDSSTDHTFSITDGDAGDGSVTYEWQVSADGALWLTDRADGTNLVVTLDEDDDTDDLSVIATLEPRANYTGTTAFWLRCRKTYPLPGGGDSVTYSTRQITVTVSPLPDAPSAPLPSRMPTVSQGGVSYQTMTWVEVDAGDTGTLRVRPIGGSWSTTSVSLGASVGTVTVEQGALSDMTAAVTFVPHADFRGRYAFEQQVIDGDGLTSPVVRVLGVVASRGLYAELVWLTRSETSAELQPLGPVPMFAPELEWAVRGSDGASCEVDGAVIRRLADLWDTTPDELVAPWACELHVWGDGQLQVAGPVTRREYDFGTDRYRVEARGVAAYLERRELEDGDTTFSNVEQATIVADLIDDEQARSYGDLLIDTSTVTATGENRTVTYTRGTTVADAISELQDQLDGCEVSINADRELRTGLWLGTDRRNVLVFTSANTVGLTAEDDGDALTTVAHVDGEADPDAVVHGSSSAGTSALERFGRVCSRAGADRIGTTDGANAAAARLINVEGVETRTVRFTHLAPAGAPLGRGAWDYTAGDVCSLEVTTPRGVLHTHGRIINKRLRPAVGPTGGYRIELDVELLGADGEVRPARSAHTPEFVASIWDLYRR